MMKSLFSLVIAAMALLRVQSFAVHTPVLAAPHPAQVRRRSERYPLWRLGRVLNV